MTDIQSKDTIEEVVPDTHQHLDLTRQETKALHKVKKQLELQRSDLIIKQKQITEAIQEVYDLLHGIDKVFVGK